jgi:hypothetical protein
MAAHPLGLLAYAVATACLAVLVVFAQRDRDFPLPLARRAGAVVLSLDSATGWIALGGSPQLLESPGWMMTLALLGAANIVTALGTLLRAVSIPTWLRGLIAAACFFAIPVFATLLL